MDVNPSKQTVHWIELLVAAVVVGFILIGMAASIRTAMARERDAARAASLAATRAAVEQYAATKGVYPLAETPIVVSGGCVDAEAGIVAKAQRTNCSAVIVGIPDESRAFFALHYRSSADGKGYALSVQEESKNSDQLLCGTVFGIMAQNVCLPVARPSTF